MGPKMDKDCPCTKDCPERTATCHGTCDRFRAYDNNQKKKYESRARISDKAGVTYQYLRDRNARTYRRHVRNK